MSEPRTLSDQPHDPRTGSHYHPEFAAFFHAEPDRSIPWPAVAVFAFAVGLVAAAVVST